MAYCDDCKFALWWNSLGETHPHNKAALAELAFDAGRAAERQRIREAVEAKAKLMGSYQGGDFYAVWLSDVLQAIDGKGENEKQ